MPTTDATAEQVLRGDPALLREIERRSRSVVSACLQCHKCSGGCPVAVEADWRPSQVMRLLQLGEADEVLTSSAIWLCASCQACSTRCPMGIDVARVMDVLRMLAVQRRAQLATTRDRRFASAFLGSVRRHGRVYELGMLAAYKLVAGGLFEDLGLGLRLALAGKLRFLPDRGGDVSEIRRVFRRARDREESR
jgi:heterodisulfide reductase subunit C